MRQKPITGTIIGIFDGVLDGVQAQLIRKTPLGYTVELLESKREFQQGDRVHLSGREFTIHKAARRRDRTEVRRGEPADGAAVRPTNGQPDLRLPSEPLTAPTPVDRSHAALLGSPPHTPASSPTSRVQETSASAR